MHAGLIIVILKVAVVAVTILLAVSLVALWTGKIKLHGRINILFFVLTMTAVLGLEVLARWINPEVFNEFLDRHDARGALRIHLCFSVPAALVLPIMLFTGLKHRRSLHIGIGIAFLVLWVGTFITGIFFLPTELP